MFETVDVGILSIIPPMIAIVLALITKEVISALLIGILSGTLIYVVNSGGGVVEMGTVAFGLMAETVGEPGKFNIILFLGLLGALVYVVTIAGGSRAYGNWAATKLKSRRSAQLATSALGVIIFVDDYFNCLTVGTVMKPVTDKYQISRPSWPTSSIPPQHQSASSPRFPVGQQRSARPFMKRELSKMN